jgi:hypothetical protein
MRTSFHHQPEAQHPKSSAIHKLPADYPIFRANRTLSRHRRMTESDPGCVKTQNAVVGAQHKNRTRGLGEVLIRQRHSVRINLASERSAEWF